MARPVNDARRPKTSRSTLQLNQEDASMQISLAAIRCARGGGRRAGHVECDGAVPLARCGRQAVAPFAPHTRVEGARNHSAGGRATGHQSIAISVSVGKLRRYERRDSLFRSAAFVLLQEAVLLISLCDGDELSCRILPERRSLNILCAAVQQTSASKPDEERRNKQAADDSLQSSRN
jgi:hypothetical protein